MIQLCKDNNLIWPTGVEGGPTFYLINPTASQVMSPTDLPQCHQLPGDSAKLLDHLESTLMLGLECLLLGQEPRLQLRPGGCFGKLFTSIGDNEEASRERYVYDQQEAYNAAAPIP